nr:hypothetical protein GCM10020093_001870 [Planobispora longispora]
MKLSQSPPRQASREPTYSSSDSTVSSCPFRNRQVAWYGSDITACLQATLSRKADSLRNSLNHRSRAARP